MPTTLASLEAKMDLAIQSFQNHVRGCDESNRRGEQAFNSLAQEVKSIKELPAKGVKAIAYLVAASVIASAIGSWWNGHEAAEKAANAVAAAQQAVTATQTQSAIISHKLDAITAAQTNGTLAAGN